MKNGPIDLIRNPPDGITLKQAEWFHRLVLATIEEFKKAGALLQPAPGPGPDLSDDEWVVDIRNFDD